MTAKRHNAGFSLIEVMVAILILGVAVAGLTGGVTTALSSSKESELQTTAALLAAGRIETLRAEGDITDGDSDGDFGTGLSLYRWKQTITASEPDGLHEVDVSIEEAKSGKSIYDLKTLLFEAPDDTTTNGATGRDTSDSDKRRKKERQ
jgi:type IV pilus modification protein PilV